MDLDEKRMLDMVTTLHISANKLKIKLRDLLARIEVNSPDTDWPHYLSLVSQCASELSEIRKFTDSERFKLASSIVVSPVSLTLDPDPNLAKITEERLHILNHETIPQYLRTKLDPTIEQQCQQQDAKLPTANNPEQLTKMVNQMNKLLEFALKEVNHMRQEVESDLNSADHVHARTPQTKSARTGSPIQSQDDPLNDMIAAITCGSGLSRTSK